MASLIAVRKSPCLSLAAVSTEKESSATAPCSDPATKTFGSSYLSSVALAFCSERCSGVSPAY